MKLAGEIDVANASEVEDQLRQMDPGSSDRLVLDLNDLSYLDSCGVRLIERIAIDRATGEHPLELVAGPNAIVRRVLELTGLLDVVVNHEDGLTDPPTDAPRS